MPKTTITLDAWKCCRCGYSWVNRKETTPLRCASASCGSVYWDIPRKKKEDKEIK